MGGRTPTFAQAQGSPEGVVVSVGVIKRGET